jgi:hypothetical protein
MTSKHKVITLDIQYGYVPTVTGAYLFDSYEEVVAFIVKFNKENLPRPKWYFSKAEYDGIANV